MAKSTRKRVALLFLGGATIDEHQRSGGTVATAADVEPWLRAMSEMDIMADTKGVFISAGLTDVGISQWQSAGTTIKALYHQVDGFVIVHQVATLPAAAVAVSLMVQQIGKPVVLCGSLLLSAAEKKAGRQAVPIAVDYGAKANFINAVQVAVSDVAGVMVVNGSHIYRGRTVAGPWPELRGQTIGKIDFGIRFFGQQPARHQRPPQLQPAFATNVAVVEYLPGLDIRQVLHLTRGTRAIFLSSTEGPGAIQSAVDQLQRRPAIHLPIAIYTELAQPPIAGTLTIVSPSRATALIKLMWALGHTADVKQLKKLLA